MIRAKVLLDRWHNSIEPNEVSEWCIKNIGPRADLSDKIDKYHPWGVHFRVDMFVYYFSQESDATMFRLKWL